MRKSFLKKKKAVFLEKGKKRNHKYLFLVLDKWRLQNSYVTHISWGYLHAECRDAIRSADCSLQNEKAWQLMGTGCILAYRRANCRSVYWHVTCYVLLCSGSLLLTSDSTPLSYWQVPSRDLNSGPVGPDQWRTEGRFGVQPLPPHEIPKFWQSRTGLKIERKMFSVPIPTS